MERNVGRTRYRPRMSGRPKAGKSRARGHIETLPSGALRVSVYAGVDAFTKKRHNLVEVIPPGPNAERAAETARQRLVLEVSEDRNPRTSATTPRGGYIHHRARRVG